VNDITSPKKEKFLFSHFLKIHFFIDYDAEKIDQFFKTVTSILTEILILKRFNVITRKSNFH